MPDAMENHANELRRQRERLKWIIRGIEWSKLSPWEEARLEEWEGQVDRGKMLTDKQMEIVERIYREKGR